MGLTTLKSARLRAVDVAHLRAADRAALLAPEVVAYLPPGFQGLETDAERLSLIEALQQEAEVIALTTDAGQVVGLVILSLASQGSAQRNLGYLFTRAAWGQGYAGEMLRALQEQFRGKPVVLSGGVMAENVASARVLEKSGFIPGDMSAAGEVTFVWDAARG